MGKLPSFPADLKLQQLTLLFRQTRPGFWLAARRDRAEKENPLSLLASGSSSSTKRGHSHRFARQNDDARQKAMSIEITSV